jgi:hypothetical protein
MKKQRSSRLIRFFGCGSLGKSTRPKEDYFAGAAKQIRGPCTDLIVAATAT